MRTSNVLAVTSVSALALVAGLTIPGAVTAQPGSSGSTASLPDTLVLPAVIRDVKAKEVSGGHPDFQAFSNSNITTQLVEATLDREGKPVFRQKRGMEITTEYTNAAGQPINPAHFDRSKGDRAGATRTVTSDQLTSADRFSQWYRDVPGVNVSKTVPLTFNRVPNTNSYVFDSATDQPYSGRGGFYPINSDLYGNYASTGKNYHFTTEISTEFVYERNRGHVFTFTGDDDVWVFIDNKLVLDLGGLHPRKTQTLELDRLAWLENGRTYSLKVFHAERHTTDSNFRIETTLGLRPADLPQVTNVFD